MCGVSKTKHRKRRRRRIKKRKLFSNLAQEEKITYSVRFDDGIIRYQKCFLYSPGGQKKNTTQQQNNPWHFLDKEMWNIYEINNKTICPDKMTLLLHTQPHTHHTYNWGAMWKTPYFCFICFMIKAKLTGNMPRAIGKQTATENGNGKLSVRENQFWNKIYSNELYKLLVISIIVSPTNHNWVTSMASLTHFLWQWILLFWMNKGTDSHTIRLTSAFVIGQQCVLYIWFVHVK